MRQFLHPRHGRRGAAGFAASAVVLIALVGCGATSVATSVATPTSAAASSSAPAATMSMDMETVWANKQTIHVQVVSQVPKPTKAELDQAPAFYILGFPKDDGGNVVVPAGYTPQCAPCAQAPEPQTHDHVLADGAVADSYQATAQPWRPTVLMYDPAFIKGGHFAPVKNEADLTAAIAAHEFLPIGPNGSFKKALPFLLVLQVAGS